MRSLFYIVCSAFVIGLAYWAYKENYQTQAALRDVKVLQQKIAEQKEAIAVLNAEWAYLNRPDRLRELVDMNFEDLRLIPLLPTHFGDSEMIAYPIPKIEDFGDPVSISGQENVNSGVAQ